MRRHGEEIKLHPLKNPGKSAGITYNQNFLEIEAAIAAGMDVERWERGGYPKWLKAKIVAWHSLHHLIQTHQSDANYTPPKKR